LTKGQFSATADAGSKAKGGEVNADSPIDLISMALLLGATYVARSFSGDKAQLVPLIKGAIAHQGAAILDIISPCVTFNNHAGSTKSFDFVREHNEAVNAVDFVPERAEITADYAPGTTEMVRQHDGSYLKLAKLCEDYDPKSRIGAMAYLQEHQAKGELVTGLIFVDPTAGDLHARLGTADAPLNRMNEKTLCPGADALEAVNGEYR
jgi:2-oxoglutarate ferredoxin oxidoreductase subunit beta